MKILKIAVLAIAVTSCGGGGSDDKDLFSMWRGVHEGQVLDLSTGELSEPMAFNMYFEGGATCNCDLVMIGSQSSGSYVLNSCFYDYGSGSQNPGCNALNQTGTYSNRDGVLVINGPGGVEEYK